MSRSGLSKADQEILAQGIDSEKASEIKKLFGMERRDEFKILPGSFGGESSQTKLRGRSSSMKPLSSHGKGKMPELQSTREESSDDDKSDYFARDSRANLKGRWDAPVHKETSLSKKMMLDWSSFEWKPHH